MKMTQEEYDKLVTGHGNAKATKAVAKLDAWLGANGDKYKSHYMAMHSWVLRAVEEDEARAARASPHGAGPPVATTQYQRDREGQVGMAKLYLAIKAEEEEKHGGQENHSERAVIDVCHVQQAH